MKQKHVPPAADYNSLGFLSDSGAMKNARESWPAGPRKRNCREITAAPLSSSHRPLRNTKHLCGGGVFILLFVQWMKFAVTETNGRRASGSLPCGVLSIVQGKCGLNYILRPRVRVSLGQSEVCIWCRLLMMTAAPHWRTHLRLRLLIMQWSLFVWCGGLHLHFSSISSPDKQLGVKLWWN